MFRVSQRGEGIDDAESIEGVHRIVRSQPPGRHDVDEIRAEPFPGAHESVMVPHDPESGRAGRMSRGRGAPWIRDRATADGPRPRHLAGWNSRSITTQRPGTSTPWTVSR
jgi:hypothetical protein